MESPADVRLEPVHGLACRVVRETAATGGAARFGGVAVQLRRALEDRQTVPARMDAASAVSPHA